MATDYTIPKDEYRALVAERDKLLDGFHAMQQLYKDELKHALAENSKLRELVLDMWLDLTDTGDVAEIYGHTRKYGERMKVLGLEVSDG